MLKRSAIASLLMLLIGMSPLPVSAEGDTQSGGAVFGAVDALDPPARTFTIGHHEFYVPPTISGLEQVEPGMIVSVEFDEVGGQRVVRSIRTMD